jgi:hypothetical protein
VNLHGFLKVNERWLSASTFLYFEKLLTMSTEAMGAYLKYTKSLDVNSFLISVILNSSPSNTWEMEHIVL